MLKLQSSGNVWGILQRNSFIRRSRTLSVEFTRFSGITTLKLLFDESTYTTELKLQEEDGPVNMFCETEKNCRKGGRTLSDSWSKLERRSRSSTFSHGSYSMMPVRKLLERIKPKKVSFPMSHIQLGILPWILLWERSRISNSFAIVKMSGNSLTLQADIPNMRRLGKE